MKLKFAIMAAAVAFAGSAGAAMAQDAAAGEQIFVKKCKVCHQLGKNAVGETVVRLRGGHETLEVSRRNLPQLRKLLREL